MNRVVVALVVAFLCALPSLGQQSGSNPPSSGTSQAGNINEPIPAPAKTDFWDGDDPNLVNLVTHPFASKKYVQRMTRPIKDRLNELEDINASNGAAIKDIDARAQHGIQLASEKSSLADEHATDAANKAQLAQTAATQASNRVSSTEQLVGNLDQFKGTAQTEIRFRAGQSVLSKEAKDALAEMAGPLKDQHSYVIEVRGYSAGRGQAAIASSQKMADSIVRYLVLSQNIPMYRIHMLSMGNVPMDESTKHISGGRVEVNVLKNEMASSAN